MIKTFAILFVITLCGCASVGPGNGSSIRSSATHEVHIDGASNETLAASLQAMYAQHDNKEKCLLETAIFRIQVADRDQKIAATGDKNAVADPLGPKINGMTYNEIISLSKKYPAKVQGICRD